jgi:DNA gyrase subunit B
LENARLNVNAGSPPISAQALELLAGKYMAVISTIRRMSKRWNASVLEQFIYMPELTVDAARDGRLVEQWCRELEARLNKDRAAGLRFSITVTRESGDSGDKGWRAEIIENLHGISNSRQLTQEFFSSGEYRSMVDLGRQLHGLIGSGAVIQRGERRQEITSFKQAMDWIVDEAKRGQQIQRYKGLGEMNPEQLWETTMNAETRRLLQVQIEDAVAADEIFTTLMGDQVEPRREFIEKHALSVANLDI